MKKMENSRLVGRKPVLDIYKCPKWLFWLRPL